MSYEVSLNIIKNDCMACINWFDQ